MNIALIIEPRESTYVHKLKGYFPSQNVTVVTTPITSSAHLLAYCKSKKIDAVFTTQLALLRVLSFDKKATLDNYSGSMFKLARTNDLLEDLLEVVILRDLAMLTAIPYQPFVIQRTITKITEPHTWPVANKFSYTLIDYSYLHTLNDLFTQSLFVAVDIETNKDLAITSIAYTAVTLTDDNNTLLHNFCLPITDLTSVKLMRELNAHPARKAFQNGKYDIAYLALYNAPPTNYIFDSINMHHCWYAELPKDLGSLASFYIRDFRYWKHESHSDLYEYNAKDTYTTALIVCAWLLEAPQWAKQNYVQSFPVVFPAHQCEMTGIAVDIAQLEATRTEYKQQITELNLTLDKWLNVTNFNVASPKQMKELLKLLGTKNPKSADAKALTEIKGKHPLNSLIIDKILEIRKLRKLVSTYLKDSIYLYHPLIPIKRILYAINVHGTETGRLASKEHHFWCGLNIQNIPRGKAVKNFFVADPDFYLAEADYAQAESRDTAYITGQLNLIEILETAGLDFHKYNASAFFGVPYEEVTKDLRTLSKPVNHGANYNMGEAVLIQQMGGELAVLKAGKLLELPTNWSAYRIAEHLLQSFDKTYPRIRHNYHDYIKYEVATKQRLVGATGWTRYCFNNPTVSKPALNAYVAHVPQSLNAMTLNKAFLNVFKNVALKYPNDFKLCTQIHDSILFQYRKGHEYLIDLVKDCMTFPTEVTDIDGVTRTMVVPVDIDSGLTRWGDK